MFKKIILFNYIMSKNQKYTNLLRALLKKNKVKRDEKYTHSSMGHLWML